MALTRLRSEFPLIAASVFVAFVIWLIARQGELESTWVSIPVQLTNVPSQMIVEAGTREVSLNVQFPKTMLNRIVAKNFELAIDAATIFDLEPSKWANPTESTQVDYNLKTAQVNMRNLENRVQIISMDPPALTLKARFRTQNVTVDIKTTGKLDSQIEFTAPPAADPATLTVTGTPEALQTLAEHDWKVPTQPIDLSRLQSSGQLYREVILPEGVTLLGREEPLVTINVALRELDVRQRIEGVAVTVLAWDEKLGVKVDPAQVAVVVEGPPSVLNTLRADDFVVMPAKALEEKTGSAQEVGLQGRLKESVDAQVARRVRVLECDPPRISVEFKPAGEHNGD